MSKKYLVEHNSIEIFATSKTFKQFDGTDKSVEAIIKNYDGCDDVPIDSYDSLEEAIKKANAPYHTIRENTIDYLLIEFDRIWEEDSENDIMESLGVKGIDL